MKWIVEVYNESGEYMSMLSFNMGVNALEVAQQLLIGNPKLQIKIIPKAVSDDVFSATRYNCRS